MLNSVAGSAAVRGMHATVHLLKDTKALPSTDNYLMKFEKPGTYHKTLTDFFSVNPRDVKEVHTPYVSLKPLSHQALI